MSTKQLQNIKNNINALKSIKTVNDIKTFKYEIFEDDNSQCASCIINGIPIEFLWYDEVGFCEYADESPKAFLKLLGAIARSIEIAEEEYSF